MGASDDARFLADLKERVRAAQVRAVTSLNRDMLTLYWEIGRALVERQEKAGWGDAVIDRLARDLRAEFPTLRGFSRRNLFMMRQCYLAYRNNPNCAAAAAQIPWFHNILILNKLTDQEEREWYLDQPLRNHWSRNVLRHQIETGLYHRQVLTGKTHNFDRTLPGPQSDLAQELLKDPLEYALRDTSKPIGVSAYRLSARLPRELRECLPTAGQLRAELEKEPRR